MVNIRPYQGILPRLGERCYIDPAATVLWHVKDGERVTPGQTLCDIDANARTLLTAERTAARAAVLD